MRTEWRPFAPLLLSALLAGCGGSGDTVRDGAPDGYPDLSHTPDAVPRAEPYRKGTLRPYTVAGHTYYPLRSIQGFVQRGVASWYGRKFQGRRTASGERFDMYAMTAAHRRLPLPCYVRVRNLENGRSVVVRVNDRGPFYGNRIIDLSYAAASKLGMLGRGTALVEIRAIDSRRPVAPTRRTDTAARHSPRIYVQVGAFDDPDNAQRMATRLQKELRRTIHIQPADSPRGHVLRVQIGPLASVEIADQLVDTLEQMDIHDAQLLLR